METQFHKTTNDLAPPQPNPMTAHATMAKLRRPNAAAFLARIETGGSSNSATSAAGFAAVAVFSRATSIRHSNFAVIAVPSCQRRLNRRPRRPHNSPRCVGFGADHAAWNPAGMSTIHQSSTPPIAMCVRKSKVRSSPIDHWHISVLRNGRTWTEVGGHVSEGEPGKVECALWDILRGDRRTPRRYPFIFPANLLHPASTEIRNNIAPFRERVPNC